MSLEREEYRLWTVLELIRWGSGYFQEKGIESSRLTMELLLCHVLESSRIDLYSNYDRPLTKTELDRLRSAVRRVGLHEPLQYVTGEADFYSRSFAVTPDVLIPRPETELLVEAAITHATHARTCLDVGTGSGVIAISTALHLPQTHWLCIDKSSRALEVATKNSQRHRVEDRCEFQHIDFLEHTFSQVFDLICMNPPYIAATEVPMLEANVRDYEPHTALTDDRDGMSFYVRLADQLPQILAINGVAIVEVGWGAIERVQQIFANIGTLKVVNDLAEIPRILLINRR